jgi:hypothetical protein
LRFQNRLFKLFFGASEADVGYNHQNELWEHCINSLRSPNDPSKSEKRQWARGCLKRVIK